MSNNEMEPKDVGASVLIPKGNLSYNPGAYGGMRSAMDNSNSRRLSAHSSIHNDFKTGYYSNSGINYNGHDQSTSWIPFGGKK